MFACFRARLRYAVVLGAISLSAACGAPVVDNALVNTVVEQAQRQVGTVVPIKDQSLIEATSLDDFVRTQTAKGLMEHDAKLCQSLMKVSALADVRTLAGSQESGDVISEVRLCAAQRNSPKRLDVVGVLVARHKPEDTKAQVTGPEEQGPSKP